MKNFKLSFLAILMAITAISNEVFAQTSFGDAKKINSGWKFSLTDNETYSNVDFDDKRWQNVNLPHDWSVKGQLSPTLASCTGYLPGGIGWYRNSIEVPADGTKKYYLYFEGVYNRSEVFVNGKSVGKRPNGYISFNYDITPYVEFGKTNTIAVRVDHSRSADSRWYTGSGIYRDVWFVEANPVHLDNWGVFAYPQGEVMNVATTVKNETATAQKVQVVNELIDPNGKVVGKSTSKATIAANSKGSVQTSIKAKGAQKWSLDNPILYSVKTTVFADGKTVDKNSLKTGFREFRFDPNKGFFLNGENMKVKGVCIHHDAGVLGSAVTKEVWQRRLATLKSIGVNAVRTSHNPQATHLYEACDELGLLVMNEAYDEWEFPKRKWLQGWNVGTPGFEGAFDFFEEWAERDLEDMILRDRNHISIFAWSIGNEVDYPNDPYSHPVLGGEQAGGFTQATYGGYNPEAPDAMRLGAIAKRLAAVVRKNDPSRPVTAGLAGVAMSNETEYPGALDIAGYNYTESKYDEDHKKYPNRVIYGSENRHDIDAWYSVANNEHIFGQFLWTGIDYLGESGSWPSRGFYSGLLDFGGYVKPRGYFRASLWSETPMAYLGTYPTPGRGARNRNNDVWSQLEAQNESNYVERTPSMDAWSVWNYDNEGQSIRVVCYTNCAKARLLLDSKEVGAVKDYDKKTGIIYWDIPFKAGKLEVEAMNANGTVEARYAIETSEAPAAIKAKVDKNSVEKGGMVQVELTVVDKAGRRVMLSDNEVTCHITSGATLMGMESSNNSDMTDYTDNRHRVFHGTMVVYIHAGEKEGKVNVKLTSPWLTSDEVSFEIK